MFALNTVGVFGIVWFVAWLFLAFNTPADHPYISSKEQNYIESLIKSEIDNDASKKVADVLCSILLNVLLFYIWFGRVRQLLGKQCLHHLWFWVLSLLNVQIAGDTIC